jgi:hypothetical protein
VSEGDAVSDRRAEYPISQRVDEPVGISTKGVTDARPRDLVVRFIAGGVTSIVAGVVTLVWGPRTGGVFLAFPAILAASLTLIQEQEDSHEAREDSRGAVLGGAAMIAFAIVAAVLLDSIPGALALVAATAAWTVIALGGYAVFWRRR